jgi:hypothetical protein
VTDPVFQRSTLRTLGISFISHWQTRVEQPAARAYYLSHSVVPENLARAEATLEELLRDSGTSPGSQVSAPLVVTAATPAQSPASLGQTRAGKTTKPCDICFLSYEENAELRQVKSKKVRVVAARLIPTEVNVELPALRSIIDGSPCTEAAIKR